MEHIERLREWADRNEDRLDVVEALRLRDLIYGIESDAGKVAEAGGTKGIADMVLTVGWVEGKIEALAAFNDGKVKQELLGAKSNLANLADDLICMIEGEP